MVLRLALLIAVIAVVEAGISMVSRWLSARIGEGLILDLRTAVFDHVQRMPIAFFTRTRTGALVSRLNNDVIGAQRAFSDTLSGVVSNLVMLALTLVVMLQISWQITLLALVSCRSSSSPPAASAARLAALEREAANYNATMSTQMTERFSAPGATLVKLFGRPARESAEFASRARRVRDIGVRTAMVQWIFVTALTLVSALALAVVYGLGGFYALRGQLDAGAVVSHGATAHPPVRTAHRTRQRPTRGDDRAGQLRACLRGARPQTADPGQAGRRQGPRRPGLRRVHQRPLRLPVGRQGLARLPRGGREARHARRGRGPARHDSFRAEPGQMVALVGSSGAGKSTIAQLIPRLYDVDSGSVQLAGVDVRDRRRPSRCARRSGMVTQDGHLFHDSIRENLLLARPEASRGRPVGCRCAGPGSTT